MTKEVKSLIELKPMPKIDKLTDSSSFENVSTKLQEINNLLKVSSDNLKTIMDANDLMYEPIDKFTDLVQKLNDKPVSAVPATLMDGLTFNQKIMEMNNFNNVRNIQFIKKKPNPNGTLLSVDGEARGVIEGDTLTISSRGEIFANQNCKSMFSFLTSIKSIITSNFNTSKVTDMSKMFSNNIGVTNLDLTAWNTENVTNMEYMFNNCKQLKSIDLSKFNTKNVTNMQYMFKGSGLTSLELNNFDTSNVTNMKFMFAFSENLQSVKIDKFNVYNVENMFGMFQNCTNLSSSLDLHTWNVYNLENTECMFSGCKNLTNLNLDSWNPFHRYYRCREMFFDCNKLNSRMTMTGDIDCYGGYSGTYEGMFTKCSTDSNSKFVLNYVSGSLEKANLLLSTKNSNSNVVLGTMVVL